MSDFLVTVASYWAQSDAALAQSALQAAGIDCVLDDANMAASYPTAVRGVKLRVRNTDALRANAVLESECRSLEEIGEADEPAGDGTCPACGSADVAPNQRAALFAVIAILILGISMAVNVSEVAFYCIAAAAVLFLISDRQRCAECGETWN